MRAKSILLVGCLSLSSVAVAQDQPKPPPEPSFSMKYKPEKGVVFKFGDSTSLRFDSFVQVQGTNDQDVVDVQNSNVIPRRLKLSLRSKFTDFVETKFAVDLAPLIDLSNAGNAADDDDGEVLNDAWVQGNINDLLYVRAGYFKTTFGRQRLNSSSALLLPNRAKTTGQFTFDRGVGGLVGGELPKSKFEYQAGVTADIVLANQLTDLTGVEVAPVPIAVARIVANPFGSLKGEEGALKIVDEFRASFGFNVGVPFATNNDTGNLGVGLDAAFEVDRFSGGSELFLRARQLEDQNGVPLAEGGNQLQAGTYVQAGVLVVPKYLQLGARFGVIGADPDFSDGNNNGVFNTQGLKTETSAGVNGFILERRLMLQAMFSHLTEDGKGGAEEIFTFQVQGAL